MNLSTDNRDTLAFIYAAADGTKDYVGYSGKQLAPNIHPTNRSRLFRNLEEGGYVKLLFRDSYRAIGIRLTDLGLQEAEHRRREILPIFCGILSSRDDDMQRLKSFLPDLL